MMDQVQEMNNSAEKHLQYADTFKKDIEEAKEVSRNLHAVSSELFGKNYSAGDVVEAVQALKESGEASKNIAQKHEMLAAKSGESAVSLKAHQLEGSIHEAKMSMLNEYRQGMAAAEVGGGPRPDIKDLVTRMDQMEQRMRSGAITPVQAEKAGGAEKLAAPAVSQAGKAAKVTTGAKVAKVTGSLKNTRAILAKARLDTGKDQTAAETASDVLKTVGSLAVRAAMRV